MPVTVTTPTTIIVQDSAARGPIGNTPNISIGTVTTLSYNASATVTASGNASNAILNFGIPQVNPGTSIIGAMFYYTFNANANNDVLPDSNVFHCDNPTDQANITKYWFNNFDHANANIGGAIQTIFNTNSTPKGYISARGAGAHERVISAVNTITPKSGYFQLDVTTVAASIDESIDNGDLTGFNFSVTGNVDTGAAVAYNQANSARDQANTGYGQANAAYGQANASYTQANTARDQANTGYGQANAAYAQANAAYNAANSISWVTVPGTSTSVGVAGQAAYESTGNLYICVAENVWSKFIGTTSW